MSSNSLMTVVIILTIAIGSSLSYASDNVIMDNTKKGGQHNMQSLESANEAKGNSFLKERVAV